MIYERRHVKLNNMLFILAIAMCILGEIYFRGKVNSIIEQYSGNPNYYINYSAIESLNIMYWELRAWAFVALFGLIWFNIVRIGIEKMKAPLTEQIRQQREIYCGSVTVIWHIREHIIPSYGMLYFTSAGMEYYAYKLSIRRTNFYISFEDITNFTSKKRNVIILTSDGKKYKFITEDKAIAFSYEKYYNKRKAEIDEKKVTDIKEENVDI